MKTTIMLLLAIGALAAPTLPPNPSLTKPMPRPIRAGLGNARMNREA
jgi:hypothetical protein